MDGHDQHIRTINRKKSSMYRDWEQKDRERGGKKRENTFSIENENILILYFHLSVNIPWGNSKEEEIRSKS